MSDGLNQMFTGNLMSHTIIARTSASKKVNKNIKHSFAMLWFFFSIVLQKFTLHWQQWCISRIATSFFHHAQVNNSRWHQGWTLMHSYGPSSPTGHMSALISVNCVDGCSLYLVTLLKSCKKCLVFKQVEMSPLVWGKQCNICGENVCYNAVKADCARSRLDFMDPPH